jgi:hypothetical protein
LLVSPEFNLASRTPFVRRGKFVSGRPRICVPSYSGIPAVYGSFDGNFSCQLFYFLLNRASLMYQLSSGHPPPSLPPSSYSCEAFSTQFIYGY